VVSFYTKTSFIDAVSNCEVRWAGETDTLPKVSVVMPSYNHLPYIRAAIESVLSQSMRSLELLIIDDASQDASRALIEQAVDWDDRIRVEFHKSNLGIARTLNEGLRSAEGEFVAFIASDDVWETSKLQKQLSILEKDSNLLVWSEGRIINARGEVTGQTLTRMDKIQNKRKSGYIFDELLKGNLIFGSSLILRRESAIEVMFDEGLKYLNDHKFVVELARKHPYYFIEEPLAYYRLHGGNTAKRDIIGWLADGVKFGEYLLQEYASEITREEVGRLFAGVGTDYLFLGDRRKALYAIREAVRHNPLITPFHILWTTLGIITHGK